MSSTNINRTPIIIKHYNKWGGFFYLKENLEFTPNISKAGIFFFYKENDTPIIDGDCININTHTKSLVITANGRLTLSNNLQSSHLNSKFIISKDIVLNPEIGTPINNGSPFYLISHENNNKFLRYDWSISSANKPNKYPNLVLDYHDNSSESFFIFSFEYVDPRYQSKYQEFTNQVSTRSTVVIFILVIILIMCVSLNKY